MADRYRFTVFDNETDKFSMFEIFVQSGRSLLQKGCLYLRKRYQWDENSQKEDCTRRDKDVWDRFIIISITKIDSCAGCLSREPGQIAHMECPSGCLHEKNDCVSCNQERSVNEVEWSEGDE